MSSDGIEGTDSGERPGRGRPRLHAGDLLAGRYQVERLLGEGGMGAVYEVIDHELDESVALKLLHPDLSVDADYRGRLRQEVRLARRVSHPNVCRVHDLGQHANHMFVTMELLRGPTLRQVLASIERGERSLLSLGRKLDLVLQLAAALAAAHRVGIVHRDVKPDNLIVEDDRAVLTDFGVASPLERASLHIVVGTPDYIAPEILRGEAASPASDVYACALVAFELLAGHRPFAGRGLRDAVARARATPCRSALPDGVAPPRAREALDAVLARALAGDPGARHGSIEAFAEGLSLAARGAAEAAAAVAAPGPMVAARAVAARPPAGRPAAASATSSTIDGAPPLRALPRVATVLHLHYGAVHPAAAADMTIEDTQPISIDPTSDLEQLERVVTDLGGTTAASAPGELLALFGVPRTLGDEAVRAARAGHALLDRCVSGRVGLATGRVELTPQLGGSRAAGQGVDRARVLSQPAADGQVVASAITSRHLLGRFDLEPVDGGSHVVRPGMLAGAERYDLPPLWGRAEELHLLERLVLAAIEERSPRAALVRGPAGSGKSRLRIELERHLGERREAEWLVGRASPLGGGVPLGVLRSAEPSWFAAAQEAAPLGRPAAFAAARTWLATRAAARPVVLVIDDMQWADAASRAFLAELRRGLDQLPVAILLFARADGEVVDPTGFPRTRAVRRSGDARWRDVPVDLELALLPLERVASRAIASRLAPGLAPAAIEKIVRLADGNPFFLEELARHAEESDDAAGDLPASVELAIQARLDRLPRPVRRLVHAASVVGRDFDRAALIAALGDGTPADEELDRALGELETRQIIAPAALTGASLTPSSSSEERYVFHHRLIRDVAYAQLDPAVRRAMHLAMAAHLEARVGATARQAPGTRDPVAANRHDLRPASEPAEPVPRWGSHGRDLAVLLKVAHHREAGGARDRARAGFRAAGELALELSSFQEASVALRRAEELGGSGDDAALLELTSDALLYLDTAAAGARLERALALAATPVDQARLRYKLGVLANSRADHAAAMAQLEAALALVERDQRLDEAPEPVRLLAANILGALGSVLGYELDDHRRGLPCAERAVALLESGDHPVELAQALSQLAGVYHRAGRWHDRLRCNLRNLEIARATGDPDRELKAHLNLGDNYRFLGQLDTALDHTLRALEIAIRTGASAIESLGHNNLGVILCDLGEDLRARAELDEALALAERVGYRRFLPEATATLAILHARAGDLAAAETRARESRDHAREAGSRISEGVALRLLAAICARRGAAEEVELLLAEAHQLLADDDYERARTWAFEARHAARLNQPEWSRALHDKAAAVFQTLGATLDLARLDDQSNDP